MTQRCRIIFVFLSSLIFLTPTFYHRVVAQGTSTRARNIPQTLTVGRGKMFPTIAAAAAACHDGDTIKIDAGIYPNDTADVSCSNLTIQSVGGLAHLKWGTGDYVTNMTMIPNGKGLLVINGHDVTIDGLEFSGAKVPDDNGAGIRYQGGNLTIHHSSFHGNQNGILGQGGANDTLTIENNLFRQNGYCSPTCAHNVYIGKMGHLVFRFNKSTDARDGHLLKSRATVNEVIANFLSSKNSNASYEAEFPNGGTVYFLGNVVEQGNKSDNSTILSYGAEGATNANPFLAIGNNTFFNFLKSGNFLQIIGTPMLSVKNNLFANGGTMLAGGATDLSSNKTGTSADFVDSAAGNYHLVQTSVSVNAGVAPGTLNGYDLTPKFEYVDPANATARRLTATIDVGAYESTFAAQPNPRAK